MQKKKKGKVYLKTQYYNRTHPCAATTRTILGARRVVVKAVVALQVRDERVGRVRVHHVHWARVHVQPGHGRRRTVDVVTVHLRTSQYTATLIKYGY